MCSYSDQVEDVEHKNASSEGEFDAKMKSFIHTKWFLWNFGTLNTTVQVLEMNFGFVKRTNSSKWKGYPMNFWYIEHYGAGVGDDFVAKK